jgi:hypothetical protein
MTTISTPAASIFSVSNNLRHVFAQPTEDIAELTADICYMCCDNNLPGVQIMLDSASIFEPVPYYVYARAIDCACMSGNVEIAKWLYSKYPDYLIESYVFLETCVYGYKSAALWMLSENKSLIGSIDSDLLNELYDGGYSEFAEELLNLTSAHDCLIAYLSKTA